MKSVHKIVFGNALTIVLIAAIYGFSYHQFDLLLAKLHFIEIADGLNASFLKIRLSEKNYFLYKDAEILPRIKKQLRESSITVNRMRENIVRAIGEENFSRLTSSLEKYRHEIERMGSSRQEGRELQVSVREAGRELRLFSESVISLEKRKINQIILDSKRKLFYFFCMVLFMAGISSYSFFSKMFRSIRRIERTANSISKGKFIKIEGKIPNNELGSAMTAINSMCGELATRHEQLVQSRKLASIGTLTAGVAHELGNPLNNISMVAQTYLEVYDHLSKGDRFEYMETVLQESERIKKIVQDLLDFSRVKKGDFRIADINPVIRNSLKLVRNSLDVSKIKSELVLEEGLPPVFIDEDKIQEILVNMLTNAIHAMPGGGKVIIRTSLAKDEDYIVLSIEDTGKGIAPEFLANIFDPFFSTKGTEGTGLGLSISYGIIKDHKGKIDVKSQVGLGTTFTVKLPTHKGKEGEDERIQGHGN